MPDDYKERRKEPRRPASGRVEILFEDPLPVSVEAELVDISPGGFRISHESNQIVPGLEVRVKRGGATRRARVVWTQVLEGQRLSGCMLL
jgi:hypothetical protein